MGCDFPLYAYRSEEFGPNGKRLMQFNPVKSVHSRSVYQLPCGKCMGCRLERSRQWAVRMVHEAKLYDQNAFITLTYNDQSVPKNYGLSLRDWQLFMKKLRISLDHKVRFYACGEYGDKFGRPHYHAILFNHQFADKVMYDKTEAGEIIYRSETLDKLWSKGLCSIGEVTFRSCAYVARYCTKKVNGDLSDAHYFRQSPIDGQFYSVRREFGVMSRNPGIGSEYVKKFKGDFFPSGFIVANGVKQAPPRFYLSKLTEEERHKLKLQNVERNRSRRPDQTNARRAVIAEARNLRIKTLKRNLG